MKTLPIFLLSGMFLFLAHTTTTACSLSPTAKIVTDPDGTVFYHNEAVILDGTTSTANCGSINQYRWQVDDVTVSWDAVYSHTFNLANGESERLFKVQLRVRNSAGKYGYKTMYVTVTRNNKSLYYLTDHLGSVRVTVNEQGDPVGWDDYYPFGLQMPGRTQNASNPNDDHKFTGHMLEQQGGLGIYYMLARNYDPVIGQFMSMDPILNNPNPRELFDLHNGKHFTYSPYVYTFNNPLIYTDPDGLSPRPNLAEIRLAMRHPRAAHRINQNAPVALDQARQFARESTGGNRAAMVQSLNEGEGKAVRHAFFSAINARDVGVDIARKFGKAHEAFPDNPFEAMDLMNNEIGFQIILDNPEATNEEIFQLVLEALEAGALVTDKDEVDPAEVIIEDEKYYD